MHSIESVTSTNTTNLNRSFKSNSNIIAPLLAANIAQAESTMSTSTFGGSTSSSSSLTALLPSHTSSNVHGSVALTLVSPNGLVSYDQVVINKQSTPLKNQIEMESNKFVSKSKKLGQILKLASVRGAKVSFILVFRKQWYLWHFLVVSKQSLTFFEISVVSEI